MVGDAARELGAYLNELPADASTLDSKLARQAELRTLTRKYASDIDGVLQWARESRDRLAHLDVSEEALAGLQRRVEDLAVELTSAATELSKTRSQAAKRLAKDVTGELSGLAMSDAEFTITVLAPAFTAAALRPRFSTGGSSSSEGKLPPAPSTRSKPMIQGAKPGAASLPCAATLASRVSPLLTTLEAPPP